MFMFRSRRRNLSRRLLKGRKGQQDAPEEQSDRLSELLKRLQENQLEMLVRAVETRGRDITNCVLVARDGGPHVLCCRTWRWPDLRHGSELRRLPSCRSACDPVYICCNPYHWSRLFRPTAAAGTINESPPPPYSCCAMDRLRPEDRAPSEVPLVCRNSYPESLTTNGQDSEMNSSDEWCSLAYWELTERVGPLFPVEPMAVNVFGNVPYGDGLSLEMLAQQKSYSKPPDSVLQTRCKIGLGVTLSREEDCVWVYNLSDNAIFVNSWTLEERDSPIRVPADHCLCVYDSAKVALFDNGWNLTQNLGPVNPYSIRISFVKGWGKGYSRQEITACPCWLEILLSPCR